VKSLSFFVLGLIVGVLGYHYYLRQTTPANVVRAPAERAREGARDVGDRVAEKLAQWNLTGDDIKRDLAAGGRVIRNKARVAGARIDDARIVSVIKAKYVLDDGLKALDINVDCRDGHVQLRGQVPSHEAIGRAVALALETDGVVEVNAELTAAPAS
jgi:hyperosmotically inducible periplasmic protein